MNIVYNTAPGSDHGRQTLRDGYNTFGTFGKTDGYIFPAHSMFKVYSFVLKCVIKGSRYELHDSRYV